MPLAHREAPLGTDRGTGQAGASTADIAPIFGSLLPRERLRRPTARLILAKILLPAAALAASHVLGATDAEFDALRRAMVEEISAEHPGPGGFDPRVKDAIARVPRHLFVPPAQHSHAYENRPLPIGHQQTISQPYIVALMTELLKPGKEDRVLEIGTGSGYQAAVLAELARSVYTIEIVEPLAVEARQRLARLGYRNVEVRTGDGYKGWPERAPFDAIMVTAGADEVPPPLLAQLKAGGRMVIPVGPAASIQHLTLIEKLADGTIRSRRVVPVRFVPFTRER
jgi:protein-L-isoaspartate(D-aspartate) O-methyltransferase